MKLFLVTSNRHKFDKIAQALGYPLQQIDLDLLEIQTTKVADVIEHKVKEAYRLVGKPVLVEDTGLRFEAWNGLPGALIRWFLTSVGNDGICKMLEGFANRQAVAESCIGFYDGTNFAAFSATVSGLITQTPRGNNGFGWDPIFQPDGSQKTFAEFAAGEVLRVDMRHDAAMQMRGYLEKSGVLSTD